ncbi:MAG TPA: lytic transglycosylase domain-containing protein [Thermoanaerobaculia bacterium]|nr:lytic transglycosylase domain-containing protein [Thermoanaerobaculia bacterium]
MQRKIWRLPAMASALAVFLALTFNSSPSVSSIPTVQTFRSVTPISKPLPPLPPPSPSGAQAQDEFLSSLPYGRSITAAAARSRVDGLLIAAIVEVESGFAARAQSPQGSVGLMQIQPETAADYGIRDLTDPARNLEAGSRYFADLLDRFHGDIESALAAYNAGPGVVERYRGVPPFRETKSYVKRVMDLYLARHRRIWHGETDVPAHAESGVLASAS